jgi:hypothetical protein
MPALQPCLSSSDAFLWPSPDVNNMQHRTREPQRQPPGTCGKEAQQPDSHKVHGPGMWHCGLAGGWAQPSSPKPHTCQLWAVSQHWKCTWRVHIGLTPIPHCQGVPGMCRCGPTCGTDSLPPRRTPHPVDQRAPAAHAWGRVRAQSMSLHQEIRADSPRSAAQAVLPGSCG